MLIIKILFFGIEFWVTKEDHQFFVVQKLIERFSAFFSGAKETARGSWGANLVKITHPCP